MVLDRRNAFGLEAEVPAAEGAVVAKALERVDCSIPVMPDEDDAAFAGARLADALVALASARVAADADPDRATVIVHAQLDGLANRTNGCELENGPAIHPETVERLLRNGRVQTVTERRDGEVVRLGELSRVPPAWMFRQVRYRDRGCRFPGCGTNRFTEAHHVRWWREGGKTTLDNLVLICSFHHRLVHELGWRIERLGPDEIAWLRPTGARFTAGPNARAPSELSA